MSKSINQELILEKLSRMIDYCKKDKSVNGLTALFQVADAIMDCSDENAKQLLYGQWISVKKEMPRENDSIFKKWKTRINGKRECLKECLIM